MSNLFTVSILFLLASVFTSESAAAHVGGGGQDKVVDGYLVDLGYDAEEPMASEQTRLTLMLLDNETKGVIDFENAWVRVAKGNDILFASTLERAMSDDVSFLYNFQEAGIHEVTVRFQKYSEEEPQLRIPETIIETSFNLEVAGSKAARASRVSRDLIFGIVLGAVIGGGILFFARGRKKAVAQ